MIRKSLLTLALAGSLGVSGAVLASTGSNMTGGDMTGGAGMNVDSQFTLDLQIYAAFAKLEANIAEAGGALALRALRTDEASRAELAEDYQDDIETIEDYVELLESFELTDEQRSALEAFRAAWEPVAAEGARLIAEEGDDLEVSRQEVSAWWDTTRDIDDTIDDALDGLLEVYGASIETQVDRGSGSE